MIERTRIVQVRGMPLTGQAKRDYQRQWIRAKRHRQKLKAEGRIVEPLSNPKPISVEPLANSCRTQTVEPTVMDLQAKMDAICNKPSPTYDMPPAYNPRIHKPGDTVLLKGKAVTVPEIDAEGNQIYAL
jgi:hypothetical protein